MEELVQRLVVDFPQNPAVISRALRKLSDEHWPDFLTSSLSVLAEGVASHGGRYLVSLLLRENALHGALCDPALLTISQAADIARLALVVDPHFGVEFARRLTSLEAINEQEAERILKIVEEVSDSMRIRPSLVPLLHHPNRRIRSKAALLIGRSNRNPELAEEQVSDEDARVRANAVEALWGIDDPACAAFFHEAARDRHQRVAGNAIVGLYKLHDVSSIRLLHELADRPSLDWQITAAWAIGITGSPRFQPALTRLMNAGDPHLRQHAVRSLSRIRQASRNSQLAGAFAISLWPQSSDRKGSTKLIATVGAGTESHVPNLPPTEFLLREGGQWILDYSVEEHSAPPALTVGFLIPGTGDSADPALLAYLDRKRHADQWCVQHYATEASQEITHTRIQFTNDAVTIGRSIGNDERVITPPQGLAGTLNTMMTAMTGAIPEASGAVPGSRHIICVSSASVPGDSVFGAVKTVAARARRGMVSVHAIMPPDGAGAQFFEELCRDTGGGFYRVSGNDDIPAALERIQVSLLDRYEISFTPTNPEAQDLIVQICSQLGYGEATITASPSSNAARDS